MRIVSLHPVDVSNRRHTCAGGFIFLRASITQLFLNNVCCIQLTLPLREKRNGTKVLKNSTKYRRFSRQLHPTGIIMESCVMEAFHKIKILNVCEFSFMYVTMHCGRR
jgi:hypothetical protein